MVAQKTNKFIIYKDYAEMILESKKYGNLTCYIDLEDIEKIKPYRWCPYKSPYSDNFYVQSTGRKNFSRIPLHRFITDCPKGKEVDHINHNGLDNRKSNLRVCTSLENKIKEYRERYDELYWTTDQLAKDKTKLKQTLEEIRKMVTSPYPGKPRDVLKIINEVLQ